MLVQQILKLGFDSHGIAGAFHKSVHLQALGKGGEDGYAREIRRKQGKEGRTTEEKEKIK